MKQKPTLLIGPLAKSPLGINASDYQFAILVDGGVVCKKDVESIKHVSVGDGDSAPKDAKLDYVFPKEKDESDLALSFQYLPQGTIEVHMIGFTGERMDHFFANIGECYLHCQKRGISFLFFEKNKIFAQVSTSLQMSYHGIVSAFTLVPQVAKMSGKLQYQGASVPLPKLSSKGLSNIASGEFEIKGSEPMIFFFSRSEN
jgi:thiamine pyrophosphokinase